MRAQNDVLRPGAPRAIAPEIQRRFDQGIAFEERVVTQLEGLGIAARVVDEAAGEELTTVAIEDLTVLLGPPLPVDTEGRRVGRPDMLVVARGGGYRAVEVKHHRVLDPIAPGSSGVPALASSIDMPVFDDAVSDDLFSARRRLDDLLQLAHYQRILEAAGLAAEGGRWGGVLGTEGRIVWFDLDEPMWRAGGLGGRAAMQSSIERYDVEFELRLRIIAAAQAHRDDPAVDLLAAPVRIAECNACPWWEYCRSRLEAGSGDVSLLPRVGWREWSIHRQHGVFDRAGLARLDYRTARLVCAGVDVPEFQRLVDGLEDDTPISDLGVVVRAKTHLARLEEEGVMTFGDLMALDQRTASYHGCGMSWLPEQIDLARAALGPSPVYRRRGADRIVVPRADVEVDVDMENIEEGVYLWGALHTIRNSDAAPSTYHAFVTWDSLTLGGELQNFEEFWSWLLDVRAGARRRGLMFRAYCYNASAENTYLKKLGLGLGRFEEVIEFIQSEEWVDLLRTVDGQLITGTGSGLKAIAPLTGFRWEVEDPGGAVSMVQYDVASCPEETAERSAARDWLLTYNRGDVEATLAIRDWLESSASDLPSIEHVDPAEISGLTVLPEGVR